MSRTELCGHEHDPIRLSVVSFLNTMPLIHGLDRIPDLELVPSVPSALIGRLETGDVDLALCSSIDYQRSTIETVIVPSGILGCDGPTLTVRLFATIPVERITRVHCDVDSHTSVVLLRLLMREVFDREVEIADFRATGPDPEPDWPEAVLLIGDKVVTAAPPPERFATQHDLGQLWAEHTGLPFVFAVWLARADEPAPRLRRAAAILDRQRRYNRTRIDRIAHRHGTARGWPIDLAGAYLRDRLRFTLTASCLEGLELFHRKAHEHELTPACRALRVLDSELIKKNPDLESGKLDCQEGRPDGRSRVVRC